MNATIEALAGDDQIEEVAIASFSYSSNPLFGEQVAAYGISSSSIFARAGEDAVTAEGIINVPTASSKDSFSTRIVAAGLETG